MKPDLEQIRKGVEVEMEHTDDKRTALKIALDHLKEDPKYYDKLLAAGLEETIMVKCNNCGWEWKDSKGGVDKYTCHKCGEEGNEVDGLNEGEFCVACLIEYIEECSLSLQEAEYKGRKVQLGKPMAGDVKKFKVFVKNKKGKVVKVNFGQKGVKIKKNNPKRRKSFRARHKCHTAKDRTTPRYWSCRKW